MLRGVQRSTQQVGYKIKRSQRGEVLAASVFFESSKLKALD